MRPSIANSPQSIVPFVLRRFGLLILIVVVSGAVLAWATKPRGPSVDENTAAASLSRALSGQLSHKSAVAVRCDGIRDGSSFFSCNVASGGNQTTYAVSYSSTDHRYSASYGSAPFPSRVDNIPVAGH